MSGRALPSIRPDARDALNRFSFGSPQVRKLLADLAADRARLENADYVTEAHVKAAARTLSTEPKAANPYALGAGTARRDVDDGATPRRKRAVPAWLAEPVESYGAIVLAIGVVASAGWVAMGYSEAPPRPASPQILAPQAVVPARQPAAPVPPALAVVPLGVTPAPLASVPGPVAMAPVIPAAIASVGDLASLSKLPAPPRFAPDPTTAPGAHKHHRRHAAPQGERDLPPHERPDDAVATASPAPSATPSAFQSMVRRFSAGAPTPEDDPKPLPAQQRFIGSYVMGPNGTRQFVPDP